MKNIFISIITLFVLTSCEKTVELDLEDSTPKIVIEGLVTDREGYQYVKVSRSAGFYATGKTPRVSDATVMIVDDQGNTFSFVHNPNSHADSVGYYLPGTPFTGAIGRTYTLTVVADGQTYEGSDTMFRLTPIDKLEYRINEEEQEDPEDDGRFYELLLFVKEPQDTKDYYLFKSFRNGAIEYQNDTDVYYADDELIGENIDGISLPLFYAADDVAKIEVQSLSRQAFVFYRDLSKLLNNDGGMFGTPPANPRTNLSNGAVGFFQASAIQSAELVIAE
ncbi:MAG TPA: DUF4249 domain-containing protein [Ohtaekwangia sp.]|nr:DUF4249 domain-containing protein [Ohtaekwangia sp.]